MTVPSLLAFLKAFSSLYSIFGPKEESKAISVLSFPIRTISDLEVSAILNRMKDEPLTTMQSVAQIVELFNSTAPTLTKAGEEVEKLTKKIKVLEADNEILRRKLAMVENLNKQVLLAEVKQLKRKLYKIRAARVIKVLKTNAEKQKHERMLEKIRKCLENSEVEGA